LKQKNIDTYNYCNNNLKTNKMTIKQILREYDFTNFDFNYKFKNAKTIEVTDWWGSHDTYLTLTKQILRNGYTILNN
jgi:hypothetical protein